jgi:hypothetical protein
MLANVVANSALDADQGEHLTFAKIGVIEGK